MSTARRVTRASWRSALVAIGALAVLLALAEGCGRRRTRAVTQTNASRAVAAPDTSASGTAAPDASATPDSVRGTIRVTGPELSAVVLERVGSGSVDLQSTDLAPLRRADGLEVTLFGRVTAESGVTPSSSGFVVVRFAVRAADGIPALDGILERAGDGHALRTADGRLLKLVAMPAPLRDAVGARVFWAGPLDRAPAAYGILAPVR